MDVIAPARADGLSATRIARFMQGGSAPAGCLERRPQGTTSLSVADANA